MKGFDPGIERSICRYKEGLGGLDFLLPEGKEGEEREGVLSHVRNCQSKRDRRPIAYHCKPVIARKDPFYTYAFAAGSIGSATLSANGYAAGYRTACFGAGGYVSIYDAGAAGST